MRQEMIAKNNTHRFLGVGGSCAEKALDILGTCLDLELHPQVLHGANALHGVSSYGGPCGFLTAALMAMGIAGRERGYGPEVIVELGCLYTDRFKNLYGSFSCEDLKPPLSFDSVAEFSCEDWAGAYLLFTLSYIEKFLPRNAGKG